MTLEGERLVGKPKKSKQNKVYAWVVAAGMEKERFCETLLKKTRPTLITICGWKIKQTPRFQTLEKENLVSHGRRCRFRTTDGFSLIYMTLKGQQNTQRR